MTKVIKIYYPSEDSDGIGQLTAAVREKALDLFDSAQVSYSFSSNRQSGYVMVYPALPILSIRVSNHTSQGDAPEEILFKQEGKKIAVNAEMLDGEQLADALIQNALREVKDISQDIKYILRQQNIL